MPEFWSYRLEDFLLFSPRAYWRMFALQNEALWPLPLLTLAAGAGAVVLGRRSARWSALILAVLWLWVGWSFLLNRYATINWAIAYAAPFFLIEALLLLAAVFMHGVGIDWRDTRGRTGLLLVAAALVAMPLLSPLQGRGWAESEVFGIAPDPTVVATLGFLLLIRRRVLWLLFPIPLLWCLVSGMTLYAMDEAQAWVLFAAMTVTVLNAVMPPPPKSTTGSAASSRPSE